MHRFQEPEFQANPSASALQASDTRKENIASSATFTGYSGGMQFNADYGNRYSRSYINHIPNYMSIQGTQPHTSLDAFASSIPASWDKAAGPSYLQVATGRAPLPSSQVSYGGPYEHGGVFRPRAASQIDTQLGRRGSTSSFQEMSSPGVNSTAVRASLDGGNSEVDAGAKNSGNSLATLFQLRPNVPSTRDFAVLKLSNIAWNLSIADVVAYFAPFPIPVAHLPPHYTQGVHIIMNRATGKTQSDCFIEFPTYTDAQNALEMQARGILKGRIVVAQWSTQAELMDALFPHRAGHKNNEVMEDLGTNEESFGLASESRHASQRAAGSGIVYGPSLAAQSREGVYLLREEINALLLVCKNYKLHFSRKCAERPFENIISIACKVPWHEPDLISTSHRDHIFEMLKLSLESLRIHLSRHDQQIDDTLMGRMVRAGLCVPLFTERQKVTLLNVARMPCPADLARFVYNPPQVEPDHVPANAEVMSVSTQASLAVASTTDAGIKTSCSSETSSETSWAESQVSECIVKLESVDLNKQATPSDDKLALMTNRNTSYARSASLYPSPPDADGAVVTPTPHQGSFTSTPSLTIVAIEQSPDASATPAVTLNLYAARIRMLEQALRQSEARYEELRRRHESTIARNQLEQQELINAKLRTEHQCRDLENIMRDLERSNVDLELRCSSYQEMISRSAEDAHRGQQSSYRSSNDNIIAGVPGGRAIDRESIRSLWN